MEKELQKLTAEKEVYTNFISSYIGQLLEAQTNIALLQKKILFLESQNTELEPLREQNQKLQDKLAASESNKQAFEEKCSELRMEIKQVKHERQLAQEENGKLKETLDNLGKKVDVKHNKAEKIIDRIKHARSR